MRKFTEIKGERQLSSRRRLPRLGKIRLGKKVKRKSYDASKCRHEKGQDCLYCTYPTETPYFVIPPEVSRIYPGEPTELDIMLPLNDRAQIFPQAYEYYGASKGLKCTGDGETAIRYNEETRTMEERECPCEFLEQKKCTQRAHLYFILPKVNLGGVYQMDTSSSNSIIDINSSLDYIAALVGRFVMVPLVLKRVPREITHVDPKTGKKSTKIHHTLAIEFRGTIDHLNALRDNVTKVFPTFALPATAYEAPETGPIDGEEEITETSVVDTPPTDPSTPDTFLRLLDKINTAKAIPHLKSIWAKYQPDILSLPKDQRDALELAKNAQKDTLIRIKEDCTKDPATCGKSLGPDKGVYGCELTYGDCEYGQGEETASNKR